MAQGAFLLTYKLVVDPEQTGGTTYVDATHAFVSQPGDIVKMNIYGVITNADGTPAESATSGILVACMSFLKSTNGMAGNLSAGLTVTNFGGIASNAGTVVDLNADGSMDVGMNSLAAADMGAFAAVSRDAPNPIFGNNLLLGTLTFTAADVAGDTTIYSRPRAATSGTMAARNSLNQWRLNGTRMVAGAATGTDPENLVWTNPVISGSSVTISLVPEPTTLALLGMGIIGLLAFAGRRRF
jgi:hypothetical protein